MPNSASTVAIRPMHSWASGKSPDPADRILFGTDLLPETSMYRLYFRFLETSDEYFEYPSHASRQGRWNIYGLNLPDDVLKKVYRENALRLLGSC